jgi:hypothetical protein
MCPPFSNVAALLLLLPYRIGMKPGNDGIENAKPFNARRAMAVK